MCLSNTLKKQCKDCGIEKPLADFYAHKQMADGHLNKCIQCKKSYQYVYRETNLDVIRAYDRKRGRTVERKFANLRWQQANSGVHNKACRKWDRANRHKSNASLRIYRAIKRGDLTRGTCETCGTNDRIHGHHADYSKPLDVQWLCEAHHRKEHRIYKPF